MWSTPSTRTSLLLKIRDTRDERVRDDSVELYAPIIYGDCRWETAVRLRPAAEVGEEIGMTGGAVYIAKSRVRARLRAPFDAEEGTAPAGGQDDDREPTALSG